MATTTATFDALLAPGFRKIYDETGMARPTEYTVFTNGNSSSRAYEEDHTHHGLGVTVPKPEGTNTLYDDPVDGDTKRYTHLAYSLGFRITKEMWDDDLYSVMDKFPRMLRRSNDEQVEVDTTDILNNGFTTELAADGVAVYGTHTYPNGDTYTNNVATDMSITALQTMTNYYENATNGRGLQMRMQPQLIIVAPELRFTMREIFNTTKAKPFTSDNEVNSILDEGLKWTVNHYLTDAENDAWFVMDDNKADHWPNFFWREKASFQNGFDFDSGDAKFRTFYRYSRGVTLARGLYGSQGA